MTPEEALRILDQISSQVRLNRADNETAKEAVKVLREFLESLKKEEGK